MIAFLFANGFEEVEAIAPVDILRRAGLKVVMCGVGGKEITGSHGIVLSMDKEISEVEMDSIDCLVLPGGMPGTLNLERSREVQDLIDICAANDKIIGAICAAPSILAHKGLLKGREATAFPDFQPDLTDGGAVLSESYVCRDGNFITARGMGVAVEFGLQLVAALSSPEKAAEIKSAIQCAD